MAAPMYELVGVATARLRAYTDLTTLVPATNIFTKPPASYVPPYITVDDAYSIRDDMQCVDGLNVTLNIHVWTDDSHSLKVWSADSPPVKHVLGGGALQDARVIGWQVVKALHHYPLSLPTQTLVNLAHTGERVFYNSDGVTGHGVFSFEAILSVT